MKPLRMVLGPSSSPQAGTLQELAMHIVCWHSRLLQLPVWIGPVPPAPVVPPPEETDVPPVPDGDPLWPPELAGFALTPEQPAPTASESTTVATRGRVISPYVSGPDVRGSRRA